MENVEAEQRLTAGGSTTAKDHLEKIKRDLKENKIQEVVTDVSLLILLTPEHISDDCDIILSDVINIAKLLVDESEYVTSISALKWVLNIDLMAMDPSSKLKKMSECGNLVATATRSMRRNVMREEIEKYALSFQVFLLQSIKEVQGCCDLNKSEVESLCLYFIASCRAALNDYAKTAEYCESAVSTMTDALGSGAAKRALIGACYHLSALANHEQDKYDVAIEKYDMAIEAYKAAEDLEEDQKMQNIDVIKAWKEKARNFAPID